MNKDRFRPPIIRWVLIAALVDWLVTRTLTRLGIFIPKSPLVIEVYNAITTLGRVFSTLTGLLAIAALLWIAWNSRRSMGGIWLGVIFCGLIALNLVALVEPPSGWLVLAACALYLAAVGLVLAPAFRSRGAPGAKFALLLPAMAMAMDRLYNAIPVANDVLNWPGSPTGAGFLIYSGELLVAASAIALWWGFGRQARWQAWAWAGVPALIYTALAVSNPSMSGILAIWSMGLTLYLPWPVYTLSLWLAGVTVLASWRRYPGVGPAILLLAAGGYAPQLSTQVFLGLIALWLLGDAAVLAIGSLQPRQPRYNKEISPQPTPS